jgi:hypothetical protein
MNWRFAAVGALVFSIGGVSGEPSSAAASDGSCDAWEVEYVLNATVRISDTTMGAGDGVYPNGPGTAVLRFANRGGQLGGDVQLIDYRMNDNFTVISHALLWEASVKADTVSRTTPNSCGVAAEGVLRGNQLSWKGPWRGMRSDGSVICNGGLCGKFGAPPAGRSELHVPPHPVSFLPFKYATDLQTLTMDYSVVSRQSSPSQTSRIALAGREVRRTCVRVRPCP